MPKKRKRIAGPGLPRLLAATVIIVVGTAVAVRGGLDLILTAAIPALASSRFHARVRVAEAGLILAGLRLQVRGIEVEKDGVHLTVPAMEFRPDPSGIVRGSLALADVRIERPTLELPAAIPPLSLLVRLAGAGDRFSFSLRNLRITDGAIVPRGSDADWQRIEQLDLTLPLLANTRAGNATTAGGMLTPRLSAVIGGTPATFTGTSRITADGMEARMRIVVPGIEIAGTGAAARFIPGAEIRRGTVSLAMDSVFTLTADGHATFFLSGGGGFRDLVLHAPGIDADAQEIRFRGEFFPLVSRLRLDEVRIRRPRVRAGERAAATLAAATAPPLQRLTVRDGDIFLAGRGLRLSSLDAEIGPPRTGAGPARFTVTATTGRGGSIRVDGRIGPDGAMTANLDGRMLDLGGTGLLPGLRTALARHLELALAGRLPTGPFRATVVTAGLEDVEIASPAGSLFRSASLSIAGGPAPHPSRVRTTARKFSLGLAPDEDGKWFGEVLLARGDFDLAGGEVALANGEPWLRDVDLLAADGRVNLAASPVAGGRFILSGPVPEAAPLRGVLDCRIDGVPVRFFSGLLATILPRLPDRGRVDADGRITLPGPVFRGDIGVTGLAIGNPDAASSFLVDSLDLEQVVLDPLAPKLRAAGGRLRGAVIRTRKSEGKSSPQRPWRRKGTRIDIGRLRLAGCAVEIEDDTLYPPLTLRYDIERGEVSNLGRLTAVDTTGRVNATAGEGTATGALTLKIAGIRDSGEDEFGIGFSLRGMTLAPLSPYLYRLAAFDLARGTGDWHGRVSLRRGLVTGDSRMILRDLAPKAGPDCRFDPALTLALLRGPGGEVEIDLPFAAMPVRNFSLYGVIGGKLRTLLLRSSVVPFSLLAGPNGRFPDGFVRFVPGTAEIDPHGRENLEILARGLRERPAIGIRVRGNGPPPGAMDGGRTGLAGERAAAVVQFLHDRGIDYSRLRATAGPDGLDGELLDRPPDRADLEIFVPNGGDDDGTACPTDEKMSQLPQVQRGTADKRSRAR